MFDGYYYEYDKQNKISAEKTLNADGTTTDKYSYEYDKLGQLVRFNDAVANKTYTYSYDSNGNILSKTEYAYTTGTLGAATNTTSYGYDTQWKDKLVSVGDQTITYDNIGNPTSYLGATLTWEGRNLTSYEDDTRTVQYEYDENGMRYRSTVTNKEDGQGGSFEYVWVDGKLISTVFVSDGSTQTAKYLYNDFDEPVGMVVTDEDGAISTYYYLKNAQGDITNIVSANGGKMVAFTYDVFGNKTAHYQANASTLIGMINLVEQLMVHALTPFSYRGYCYDQYTGLYYLQSRYYDPVTGRFINADDTNYLNATGTVLGCNLFAYCENDPVNNVDPFGNRKITLKTWWIEYSIDVALMILAPGFSWPYDLLGMAIEQILKKRGWKSVAKYLLKTAVPKFKGLFSKGFTLIRKAIWRITGASLSWGFSTLANTFIKKIISVLKKPWLDDFYIIASSFFSVGAFIAMVLDYISDRDLNEKIVLVI